MAETLDKVKRAFGREAVILNTRTGARGGVLGRGENPYVEITAARELAGLPEGVGVATVRKRSGRSERTEGAVALVSSPTKVTDDRLPAAILSEVGALKSLVNDLVRESQSARLKDLPERLVDGYSRLVENAVAEHIAQQLVASVKRKLTSTQLGDARAVRRCLASAIESMLPTAGPIRQARSGTPTVIALVGPTGVGKTTTIAKLAANLRLRENRKVGLITIDTYRIAAVEQLKTYADIIDIPLEVVTTPVQLERALSHMADMDFIFIDTAGRSQKDAAKIDELASFFGVRRPDEVHLVLSGTCGESVLLSTIEAFSKIGVDRIIFSKLDEAIGFGVMLSCLRKAGAKLSYVTTGQDVPDDIRVGEGKALAQLIIGKQSVTPGPASDEGTPLQPESSG